MVSGDDGPGDGVLYTFGLPGSLGLWAVAPFNPPWLSTAVMVAAGTAGSLGAYRFSARLGEGRQRSKWMDKFVDVLRRREDMFTLAAVRMLPGFPHSTINFACGLLEVPLSRFVVAAVVGMTVKWGVYAGAIHGITDAVEAGEAIGWGVLLPLIVLAVLALVGAWARRKVEGIGG